MDESQKVRHGGGSTSSAINGLAAAWIYSAAAGNLGTVILTLQGTTKPNSFQLVERPLIHTGKPDKIIVEGGP